jgi:signal transduction histidine kinase
MGGAVRLDKVRLIVWIVVAFAVGVCAEWVYARSGASRGDMARDLAVGWAFAGAGLVAWWRRPASRTGRLMLAEGLTWFIGNLQGTSVPLLFAVGAWWEALNLAVLAHLLLSLPDGRLITRLERGVVRCAYGLVAVGGLIRASTYDPAVSAESSYLACQRCGPNALLVHSDPAVFDAIDLGYRGLGALLTLACGAAMLRRWRASSQARRRVLLPAWISVIVSTAFVAWEVVYATAPGLLGAGESVVVLMSDLIQVAVPIAFLIGLLRMRLRRAAVGNLVIQVGVDPTPRRLQDVLAQVLGDSSLRLGLRESGDGEYRTWDGRSLRPPPAGSNLGTAFVHSHGEPSAMLVYDAALDDDPELLTAVRASVGLLLENSELRSQATARAQEARAVSSRIVQAVDRERQRLERDLHDGAQTRMVFALTALRRLDATLGRGADAKSRRTLAEADQTLRLALEDLRTLARGIHPAVLTREGLGPAVTALAEQAEVPVVVAIEPGRYPQLIEATAYFAVCEALSNAAKHAQAGAVSVSARRVGQQLVVEAVDDGIGGADPDGNTTGLRGLADRIAAVGGVLHVNSPAGQGTRIRAELPCE